MANMARSSIDSMWKYSYKGSEHICTQAKKVITSMFQSWTRGSLCLLLLGSLPFLAPVILVTMMVGGVFVVPLLCAVTAYYVLFRRFSLPNIIKWFSSPKPPLRMEDLDTHAEEYRNRGASIGTPNLDYESTCEETLDSDSEFEIVEEDPASEADAAIAKPDVTKEAEARPAEPEVFVEGATPIVQEKEVLPLVVSEILWEDEQTQGVAEEIEAKVHPGLESAEPFMKQQTLPVRSEPVELASSVGDVLSNAGTVAVQEVASSESVTPLEEVHPEKTEMLEVPVLDEKVVEVFAEETTSSETDAPIAELDMIKEASIVLEKDVEFPLIMSAPVLIEKEAPEVVKVLEAVAVPTMEPEVQLMDEQPFSVKSASKELVSSVEDVPAISLIARVQEFVTPLEESDIEKVEEREALMMQVKEVEASVQEARSLETVALIPKSEVTMDEEDRHAKVPVVLEKEVLPSTVPDSESEVKEAPAVGRETTAEGDPGMESAIQSMIPHQSLLVESEPVELASSAEDFPAITEIAAVHDVVLAEVAIEESEKFKMIEASVMEKELEAPVQDAGTPENDALTAEADVTKEVESKFGPSSDVLVSTVGKADTPVVQKEAVGASSLEFEVSSLEQQSSPVDDEYVELASRVVSVPAIAETAAVKDAVPSEVVSSVEEFDVKGVDIGGALVTEVRDVKGAQMEVDLPEQVEKPEAPVVEEEVKFVAETGAMEMELIKEAEAGVAAPEVFVERKVPAVQDNTEIPSALPEPLLEEKEALVVDTETETETDTYMKQQTSLVDSEPVVLSSPFAGVSTIAEAAVNEEVAPTEVVDLIEDSNVGKVEVPDVLMVEEEVEAPAEEAGSSKIHSLIESDLTKEGRAGPAAPEVFVEEEVPVVQEKDDDLPSVVVAPVSEGQGSLGVMEETEAVDISALDFDRPRFEVQSGVDHPVLVAGQQNLEPNELRKWTIEFQSSSEDLEDSGELEHSVENKVVAETKGHLVDQTTVPGKEQKHFTENKTANKTSTLELPLIGSKMTKGVDADQHAASVVVAAEEAPLIQEKRTPIAAEDNEVAPPLKAKATDAGEKTKLVEEPVHVEGTEADKVEESETLSVEEHDTKPQVAASKEFKCEEVLDEDGEASETEVLIYDCVAATEAEDASLVLEKAGFPLVELELRSEEKEMTTSEETTAPRELEHRELLSADKSQIVQEVQEKNAHVERTEFSTICVEVAEEKTEAVEGPEQDFSTLRPLNVAHNRESSRDEKFQESVDFSSTARAQRRLSFENEEVEFGAPLSPHRRRGFEATDILFRSRLGRGHPTHRHSAPDCLGTHTWVRELPSSTHQEKHRIHKEMKYKLWSESSEGVDEKILAKPGRSYSASVADSGEPYMGEFEGLLKSWKERDKTTLHTSVASSASVSRFAASSAEIVRQIREEITTIQRIIGQEIPPQCSLWKEVEILTQIVGMELPYMGDVSDLTKARQGLDLLKVVVGITCT